MVSLYGAVGIFSVTTAWEIQAPSADGAAPPLALRPGAVYRLDLTTTCFVAPDYRVHLAAWSPEAGAVAADAAGALFETRHRCRSFFETPEFAVKGTANFTVEWNMSGEVFAHGPRLRLVERSMTFFQGMDLVCAGALGAVCASPVAFAIFEWLRRRPPKGRRSATRAPSRPTKAYS